MDWSHLDKTKILKKISSLFKKVREFLPEDCDLSFDTIVVILVPTAIEQGKKFQRLGYSSF